MVMGTDVIEIGIQEEIIDEVVDVDGHDQDQDRDQDQDQGQDHTNLKTTRIKDGQL